MSRLSEPIMLRHCVLCLVVIAICCVNNVSGIRPLISAARALMSDSSQAEFDYFMFVRQWPGGYCSQHSCPRLHTHGYQFTIHGLWPNYDNGKWPQFCNADLPFREADIDDLSYAMDEEWPSFTSANAVFWGHEWNKHGTCALHVLSSEHKYFKTVLKLHYKFDLSAAFHAAGIEPSSSRSYSKDVVLGAVDDLYGAEPQLHCSSDGTLMEVWMCLDKELKPFSCSSLGAGAPANDFCSRVRLPPPPNLDPNHGGWLSPTSPDADKADASEPHGALVPDTSTTSDDKKQTADAATQTESQSQGSVAWTALKGADATGLAGEAAGDVDGSDVVGEGGNDTQDDDDEDDAPDAADDDDEDADDEDEDDDEHHHHHHHDDDDDDEDDDEGHHHHHHQDDDDDKEEEDAEPAAADDDEHHHHHHHHDDADEHGDEHHHGHGDSHHDDHHEDHHDGHHEDHHHHHHHAHDDEDKSDAKAGKATDAVAQSVDTATQTDDDDDTFVTAVPPAVHVSWLMVCGCAAMVSTLVAVSALMVWLAASRSQALLLAAGGVATGVPAVCKDPEAQALLAVEDVKGAKGLPVEEDAKPASGLPVEGIEGAKALPL